MFNCEIINCYSPRYNVSLCLRQLTTLSIYPGISPPHNIVYSDREIAFNEGESFTLLCRADGDPEPE